MENNSLQIIQVHIQMQAFQPFKFPLRIIISLAKSHCLSPWETIGVESMGWQSAKPENKICKGSPLSQKFGTVVMTTYHSAFPSHI